MHNPKARPNNTTSGSRLASQKNPSKQSQYFSKENVGRWPVWIRNKLTLCSVFLSNERLNLRAMANFKKSNMARNTIDINKTQFAKHQCETRQTGNDPTKINIIFQ